MRRSPIAAQAYRTLRTPSARYPDVIRITRKRSRVHPYPVPRRVQEARRWSRPAPPLERTRTGPPARHWPRDGSVPPPSAPKEPSRGVADLLPGIQQLRRQGRSRAAIAQTLTTPANAPSEPSSGPPCRSNSPPDRAQPLLIRPLLRPVEAQRVVIAGQELPRPRDRLQIRRVPLVVGAGRHHPIRQGHLIAIAYRATASAISCAAPFLIPCWSCVIPQRSLRFLVKRILAPLFRVRVYQDAYIASLAEPALLLGPPRGRCVAADRAPPPPPAPIPSTVVRKGRGMRQG
jgi:hypothetical protein